MNFNRKIITEDGEEYYGYAFGDTTDKVCELVFNTSMAGYQEIISDPSYTYGSYKRTMAIVGEGLNACREAFSLAPMPSVHEPQ